MRGFPSIDLGVNQHQIRPAFPTSATYYKANNLDERLFTLIRGITTQKRVS